MFILQVSKPHVWSSEDERKSSGSVVCKCMYVHTHKHFSTFKKSAAEAYSHPSLTWSTVSLPLFCFSCCLPSFTEMKSYYKQRTKFTLKHYPVKVPNMAVKYGAIGGFRFFRALLPPGLPLPPALHLSAGGLGTVGVS